MVAFTAAKIASRTASGQAPPALLVVTPRQLLALYHITPTVHTRIVVSDCPVPTSAVEPRFVVYVPILSGFTPVRMRQICGSMV
jgi:hypothetical protein